MFLDTGGMFRSLTNKASRDTGRFIRWLCVPGILVFAQAGATPGPAVEYQVKASLVFNFMHFIEWPGDAFESGGQIIVCLIGRDVYGNALRLLEREVVQGRSLAVKTYGLWYPVLANSCHVVIFSREERASVRQALVAMADKSVLSVGETPGFLEDGGIIRFTIIEDTVQFEVNLDAAKRARLNISSKLLRLASNVLMSDRDVGP
jgi:hypothetical protein